MQEYIPIEQLGVFQAFPYLFSKRFSPILLPKEKPTSLDVVWLTTNDVWRQITEIKKQKNNNDYQFPYCFLKIPTINTNNSSDNLNFLAKNLYRMGTPGKPNASGVCILHRFIPADFHVEVTFITDSFDEVKRFINKWNFVSIKQKLNSNWTYDGITLSVRVDLETGLSFPDEEASVENINYYEVKGNLIIRGFMSESNLEFEPETVCEINKIIVRPVMYDSSFETLAIQVASDRAGNTIPNYIQKDTVPPSIEEIIVSIEDDGTVSIEETI